MSSRADAPLELSVEIAGQVALQAANRLPLAPALAEPALDVGDRRRVDLAPAENDRVQGTVQLAIATRVEAVVDELPRGGQSDLESRAETFGASLPSVPDGTASTLTVRPSGAFRHTFELYVRAGCSPRCELSEMGSDQYR